MPNSNPPGAGPRKTPARAPEVSIDHYLRLIMHRWWLVAAAFIIITGATVGITSRLPNIYTSATTILVDPQKVPENYVKATVTGDVRNRLGTLSQQILSATRLQKIIDDLNLYPEDRKIMAREDVIAKMSADISVSMVSGGGSQDLQAFKITYSGKEPRLVAQVTNQLASLFINENLKARELQATGTTDFLANQLQDTRKNLEAQEAKLRDFKMKHIGEMPEQQSADLQLLGQLQSQLQLESEALSRAEQQKNYLQSMMAQGSAPVVDIDDARRASASDTRVPKAPAAAAAKSPLDTNRAKLATLMAHGYTERHPDVLKLKALIEQESANSKPEEPVVASEAPTVQPPSVPPPPRTRMAAPTNYVNPVLQSQLKGVEEEIIKHKQEQQRLNKMVAGYQAKLEAIPVREQEIADLVRDYEISKAHYTQLLGNQLSAETATQLEVRQKGEKFTVLDLAQAAERPTRPNRVLLNSGGAVAGLGIGLLLALITEFLGMSITAPEQITAATGLTVLEVIPIIQTQADKAVRKRRLLLAAASGAVVTILAAFVIFMLRLRGQTF